MKLFILGGYGKTGIDIAKMLSQSNFVSQITVGGRNLNKAEKAISEIGKEAVAVQVDGTNEDDLTSVLDGYDLIVNAAHLDTVVPSLKAAIKHKSHYCDMAWGEVLDKALHLNPEAKAAGIKAIIATGISPCISNLMGVHTAKQLDEVMQLQIGRVDICNFSKGIDPTPQQWIEDPEDIFSALLDYKSFIMMMLTRLEKKGNQTILEFHDSKWVDIDPIKNGLDVPLVRGGKFQSWPYFSSYDDTWGMLPSDLSKFKPVEMWFSPFPPKLDAILREQALSVLSGETNPEDATNNFYNIIKDDPHHWLTPPEDFSRITKVWVRAVGSKNGKAARFDCCFSPQMWNVGGYYLTSVALIAAVLKILRGEIKEHGVMKAEKVFEPISFLDEVATLMPELLPDGKVINESLEYLD